MLKMTKWKRLLSGLLAVAMAFSLLPVEVLALNTGDQIKISVVNAYVDADGAYSEKLDKTIENKLTDNFDNSTQLTENSINVYIYSSDMNEAELNGSVIPYFYDEANRKWELCKVQW